MTYPKAVCGHFLSVKAFTENVKRMENHGERIIKYTESVLRFCLSRVGNRQGAEDLAAEIILYALDGLEKYEIKSLDAWVMARRAQPMRALFPVEKQ